MNRRAMSKPYALFAALLAFAAPLALSGCDRREPAPLAGAAIGGQFTLVDKDGRIVRWSDFDGKWRIVYFGYTWCPDACPTDVGVMMRGFDAFAKDQPDRAAEIQPMFITIDPQRDTPQVVGEFTAHFPSPNSKVTLLGLTGTPAQVEQAAKAFAVYHARGKDQPGGGYLMDHSRIAYLMDRDGKPVAMLPVDKDDEAVAAELAKWVR
ncbi:MAG TPA: SCO family protein [Novosphingobium sp.]|nr:SCO family protein [Novosphingobium sp.]